MPGEATTGPAQCDGTTRSIHGYDPGLDSSLEKESDSEDMFGGGALRCTFNGGNLENRCIRS